MDIQVSTQKLLHVDLTEADARAFLTDPLPLQAEIEKALENGAGIAVAPRVVHRRKARLIKAERTPARSSARVSCPDCGKGFGSDWGLNVHIARKHKGIPVGDKIEG